MDRSGAVVAGEDSEEEEEEVEEQVQSFASSLAVIGAAAGLPDGSALGAAEAGAASAPLPGGAGGLLPPEPPSPTPPSPASSDFSSVFNRSAQQQPLTGDPAAAMSEGAMEALGPALDRIAHRMAELLAAQRGLLESLRGERASLGHLRELDAIHATMSRIPEYSDKVLRLRGGVQGLSGRMAQLKRQVGRLHSRARQQDAEDARARSVHQALDREIAAQRRPAAAAAPSRDSEDSGAL